MVLGALCVTLLGFASRPAIAKLESPIPSPAPATAPSTPSLAPSGAVAEVLGGFAHDWSAITSYSATVTLFEQQGEKTQDAVFNYTFRKPSTATAYEAKGQNAGVTLVWDGGNSVVAHRAGLLSFFKKTVPLHDPLATTIRGSSIDQLSFGAILAHAQDAAGILSVAPGEVIDGVPTEAVTLVPSSSGADAGLTREIVELSTTTYLPVRVMGYADTQLVRKIDFSNVKVEGPPAGSLAGTSRTLVTDSRPH